MSAIVLLFEIRDKRLLGRSSTVGTLNGSVVAQTAAPPSDPQPDPLARADLAPLSARAVVSEAISYQGVLRENGAPVDGSRTITFTLYNDPSCTSQVHAVTRPHVPISDGLFSVAIDVDALDFDGQALWISPEVDGTAIGCQPLMAAPYALSLRPGAIVAGESADAILSARNVGSGPAISALGPISTTAETVIAVNPLDAFVAPDSVGDLELRPNAGYLEVRSSRIGRDAIVILPIDVPTTLFGTPTRLESLRVCYNFDISVSTHLIYASVLAIGDAGGTVVLEKENLPSTGSWLCHTITASDPQQIQGPLTLALEFFFGDTGSAADAQIGKITLTLVE
jgi:hypothetical protein